VIKSPKNWTSALRSDELIESWRLWPLRSHSCLELDNLGRLPFSHDGCIRSDCEMQHLCELTGRIQHGTDLSREASLI